MQYVTIKRSGNPIKLEYKWINPKLDNAPVILFLHEGLGSISMWRNWPQQVCDALSCRGLVHSRYGYGNSTVRSPNERRSINYLQQEAKYDLPMFLEAVGLANEQVIIYGHSDGGSIALLFASYFPEHTRAIAVAAPHIFVEDVTLEGIEAAKEIYLTTNLKERLGRHHKDPESVFWSWNDTWLEPEFSKWNIEQEVAKITTPVLALQGIDDEYGTLEQIYGIQRLLPQTQVLAIPDCAHSPHKDQPQVVIQALKSFLNLP